MTATLTPIAADLRQRLRTMTLAARTLLTKEALNQLEGVYGVHPTGRLDPVATLPALLTLPKAAETRQMLETFLRDHVEAGMSAPEAVTLLAREVAFTWLNRLAAFKLMEARKLIRQAISQGKESNGFLLWLAEPGNETYATLMDASASSITDLGEDPQDVAYRQFLLALCHHMAEEIHVLFDHDTLVSNLMPRPPALTALLALLNDADLAPVWADDETVGWIYQFFNEEEKDAIFARLNKGQKIQPHEIPVATQLYTPQWIVQALVENSLGRLWLQMHPDSRLRAAWTSLVEDSVTTQDLVLEPVRPVKDITFLDPACGTMHFGLVAFDLFQAMYREELERAGQPDWPTKPSVASEDAIPAAIIENNIHGMDIDLRAVQLAALALYIKAKTTITKNNLAWAVIADHNLTYSTLRPGERHMKEFLDESPELSEIEKRIVRDVIWARMDETHLLGSLVPLELDAERIEEAYITRQGHTAQLTLAGLAEDRAAAWKASLDCIGVALDRYYNRRGLVEQFFTKEAHKGLALLRLMSKRYDVVATNPPYLRGLPRITCQSKRVDVQWEHGTTHYRTRIPADACHAQ